MKIRLSINALKNVLSFQLLLIGFFANGQNQNVSYKEIAINIKLAGDKSLKSADKATKNEFLKHQLNKSSDYEFRSISEETDKNEDEHERFQLYFKAIKVEHAIVITHHQSRKL